jgi:hypothetical protein
MNPGGLERVRVGREDTRQSILAGNLIGYGSDCESSGRPIIVGMAEAELYGPPGPPLPTVAHDRRHGITALRVYCAPVFHLG